MKIIIEQKDVGIQIDLFALVEQVEELRWKYLRQRNLPDEELDNSLGETLSGAKVAIVKERKKPGPKKGSRKKKTNTVKFTTEQLKQEISKTHPDLADKIQL